MAVFGASLVVGAVLALAVASSSAAQVPAKADVPVRSEDGPALQSEAASGGVRVLGGTVCLPGTGMVFFAGPPERRDVVKVKGSENAREPLAPASQKTQEPPRDGPAGSDAGAQVR
jgi:hypothetical protein